MERPATTSADRSPRRSWRGLPRGVWALGAGSLCMDTASELVHSLLPVLMASGLGASMLTIGLVEGVAEATASVTKVFSGALSDRLGRRKPLILLGYGLGAASKPVFAVAGSMVWVFAARFGDRVGKGVRGAPRDALVADLVEPRRRGAAFGLRQALDSVGAFLGPLLAIVLMARLADDIRKVMWFAAAPAALAVVVLAIGVREPEARGTTGSPRTAPALAGARLLPRPYWLVVALGVLLTLARFSEAFLILRARDLGLAAGLVPLVMVVMNVAYAGTAYPGGRAADRLDHRRLLAVALLALVTSDLVLAGARAPAVALAGAALWGLHMGLSQGLLAKLVADTAPAGLRGTAFGVFNLALGLALLLASLVAGLLWNAIGAPATFLAGAAFAALALIGLRLRPPRPDPARSGRT